GNTSVNRYTYDLWGNPLTTTEGVENPFRYSGEMWDQSAGLQYLRARWYDPSMGRFISKDTYEGQIDNPLTMNLYTYVHNNPLIFTDPSGHMYENLTEAEEDRIASLQSSFYLAKAKHDIAGMQSYHDQAVAIRLASGEYEVVYRTNYTTGKKDPIEGTLGGVTEDWLSLSLAVPALAAGIMYAPALISSGLAAADVATIGTTSGTIIGGASVAVQTGVKYYQVTSKAAAKEIMEAGVLTGSKQEAGQVFVFTQKPTLAQAKLSGARSFETVIEFEVKTGSFWAIDGSIYGKLTEIARKADGPVQITNVKEVGY
ncbi:RHS repeat-associated core domain-containing protein, partial [Paenibacillus oenotherae]